MNKTSVDSDHKCDSCVCDDNTHVCCHGGHRFWFWATIRIVIVVLLIVGAFCAGVRLGFGEFTRGYGFGDRYDRGGYGMYPGMMQDYYDGYARTRYRQALPQYQERTEPTTQTTSGTAQ